MAEEPFIPNFLKDSKKVLWWDVHNPTIATREISEKTFDQIKGLVEGTLLNTEKLT
jgi:Mg2+ and Co2+ transporter CorA